MKHINIEIKARCMDQHAIRTFLKKSLAEYKGTDHQVDTYFNVARGRLKLREGTIENYLVFYERSDQTGPKQSDVMLYPVSPDSSLRDILRKSLETLVVVDKQREIYFIDNVKFHIDTVDYLGTFVEIEAIDLTGGIGRERLRQQCEFFMEQLSIHPSDLLSQSYSDMLLQ